MLKKGILVVILLPFLLSVSAATSRSEVEKNFAIAQKLAAQGQTASAINIYQSLIFSHPQLPEAYNNIASLYLKQGKTDQAKNILEQGLRAHKGYGVLYESLTAINVAMAREAYSKALQLDLKPSGIKITSVSLTKVKTIVSKPIDQQQSASQTKTIGKTQAQKYPLNKNLKNSKEIKTVLNAWSAAWSAQATNIYLSFYHQKYIPGNGLSRKGWMQSRQFRLKKPKWIKVGISDLIIKQNTGSQAIVNFQQNYQSNSFNDVSTKQVVLLLTDDGWRIFREKSL